MNEALLKEAVELNERLMLTWDPVAADRIEEIWLEIKKPYGHLFTKPNIGDQVGAGWWGLLLETFAEITVVMQAQPDYVFAVKQIKEKFGGLRFYYAIQRRDMVDNDEGDDALEDPVLGELYRMTADIISKAEETAAVTCEVCGEAGSSGGSGWIKTLCDHHNNLVKSRNR